MGFRFRKSIKVLPGIRVHLTSKGVSSISVGNKGARVNINKKGTRTTVSLPDTGLSHSSYQPHQQKPLAPPSSLADKSNQLEPDGSKLHPAWIAICIFILLLILFK